MVGPGRLERRRQQLRRPRGHEEWEVLGGLGCQVDKDKGLGTGPVVEGSRWHAMEEGGGGTDSCQAVQ